MSSLWWIVFLKAAHFIPLPKLPSARETAQVMVDHVFRIHGLPSDIVSDRGPQFASQFWKEFCHQIGASPALSSGFHPQTNGQAERTNQILGRLLRSLTSRTPASWCDQLAWAEYAHNSSSLVHHWVISVRVLSWLPTAPIRIPRISVRRSLCREIYSEM